MSRVGAALAAVLLGLPAAPAPAAELGRLFTTPAERAAIDAARARGGAEIEAEPIVAAPVAAPVPPPEVPRIEVNGVVRRQDGRGVAWVNGQNTLTGDFASSHIDVRVRDGTVSIVTPEHLPDVTLRPGQAYEPGTQRIVDITTPPAR